MELTPQEAAEIAAEIVEAIDWQTDHVVAIREQTVDSTFLIEAITPKKPATLRLIEQIQNGSVDVDTTLASMRHASDGVVRVILTATTASAIAAILGDQGYETEAVQIVAALDRSDANFPKDQ